MEPKTVVIDNKEYIVINGEDFLPYEVMENLVELGLAKMIPMPYEGFKKLIDDEK
jgi:hypothetical protein